MPISKISSVPQRARPGIKQMAGLDRHERHRVSRNEAQAPDFARTPSMTGWQVHGEDRYSARIHLLDDRSASSGTSARKPRPEKCVDYDVARLRIVGVEGSGHHAQASRAPRGVALQNRRVPSANTATLAPVSASAAAAT